MLCCLDVDRTAERSSSCRREGNLVCTGGVTGPDRPCLKGVDKVLNKWCSASGGGYKSVASHILQSVYDISGNSGSNHQAIFRAHLFRGFKILSSRTYTLVFYLIIY